MSHKHVYVVARITNYIGRLCIGSNCPKALARHIEDHDVLNALFDGRLDNSGLKLITVGMDGEDKDTSICIVLGAMVPNEYSMHYSDVVKLLDKALFNEGPSMFWNHNTNYIIVEDTVQGNWWTNVTKEMNRSYAIEHLN